MMKLRQISSNCNELALAKGSILFSYETPVAISFDFPVSIDGQDWYGIWKTEEKFSKTTTRHINSWTATVRTLPQEKLLALASQILRS